MVQESDSYCTIKMPWSRHGAHALPSASTDVQRSLLTACLSTVVCRHTVVCRQRALLHQKDVPKEDEPAEAEISPDIKSNELACESEPRENADGNHDCANEEHHIDDQKGILKNNGLLHKVLEANCCTGSESAQPLLHHFMETPIFPEHDNPKYDENIPYLGWTHAPVIQHPHGVHERGALQTTIRKLIFDRHNCTHFIDSPLAASILKSGEFKVIFDRSVGIWHLEG